jgi:hypothetical protein
MAPRKSIAVNSTRSYGQNHPCQRMKAVVNGRRVIASIMSLFLNSAKGAGSLPGALELLGIEPVGLGTPVFA